MTNLTEATAAAVRKQLRLRNIRQRDAANTLDMSQQALSDRLIGRTPFTLADLERLAERFGVDVAMLLAGQDPSEQASA